VKERGAAKANARKNESEPGVVQAARVALVAQEDARERRQEGRQLC